MGVMELKPFIWDGGPVKQACFLYLKGNSGQKKYLQILFLCCPDENPSKMMKFAKNRKSKALLVRKLSTFLSFVMTSFLCKIQRMYTKPI